MKTTEIGAFEAKTHLSRLLEKVREGETFYITRRGRRIAELRPLALDHHRPRFGSDQGRVTIGTDFDAPLPEMQEYTR